MREKCIAQKEEKLLVEIECLPVFDDPGVTDKQKKIAMAYAKGLLRVDSISDRIDQKKLVSAYVQGLLEGSSKIEEVDNL